MACATTLYFDLETDAAIRRLWQAIEDAGLPSAMLNLGYRPHLTLAVCETLDLASLRGRLPELVASTAPIPLTFSNLGVFIRSEGVVYLGVNVTQVLNAFHQRVWALSQAFTTLPAVYYSPDEWVPHITLGYGLLQEQVGPVIDTLLKSPLPVSGHATELVVTDISTTGYVDLYAGRLGTPVGG